jgi:acetyltransferase-like isoleucine patch superfamily enzyme
MLESLFALRRRLIAAGATAWDRRQKRLVTAGKDSRILPAARIVNPRTAECISIGAGTLIAGELLIYPQGGRIAIGDYCYIGEGSRVWSAASLTIGHRVFIAHGVNIHDSDAHSLSAAERHHHFRDVVVHEAADFAEEANAADIVIANDVWIGFNSTVLKGIKIGEGAVVGAGSVVTRDVEPYTVVAGNPAVSVGKSLP